MEVARRLSWNMEAGAGTGRGEEEPPSPTPEGAAPRQEGTSPASLAESWRPPGVLREARPPAGGRTWGLRRQPRLEAKHVTPPSHATLRDFPTPGSQGSPGMR